MRIPPRFHSLLAPALLGISLLPADAQARPPRLAPLALEHATVFDGTGAEPLRDATILVEDSHIKAVGPAGKVRLPRGVERVDLTGKFVIPGLIDSHVHFFQSGGLYTRPDAADLTATRPYAQEAAAIHADLDDTFRRYLVHGVTAVVDVGGPRWNFQVRTRSEEAPLAPRVAATGPLISTVARPQLAYGDPPDLPIVRAASPDDARALVRAQLPYHPAFIKLWFVLTPERPLAESQAIVEAVIAEAHAAGVRVAVHATELETARAAVKAGCEVLVHSVQDKEVDAEFIALLKQRQVILIPTLVVLDGYARTMGTPEGKTPSEAEAKYGAPAALASWAEWPHVASVAAREAGEKRRGRAQAATAIMAANLKKLVAAGVTIAAGTDAGNIGTLPGPSMHEELLAMSRAGMSNREVLVAATRNGARVFSYRPEIGTLTPGMRADLLVLGADPLADLANLRTVERVLQDGVARATADILPPNPAWLADAQLAAYNRHDLEAFLRLYSDDVEVLDFPGGEPRMKGLAAMRERYGQLFRSAPKLRATLLGRQVIGDLVIDHELVGGRDDKPYFHGVAIYQIEGARIRRVWFASGTPPIAKQQPPAQQPAK